MNVIELEMLRHVLADFSLLAFQFIVMAHIQGPHKITDHAVKTELAVIGKSLYNQWVCLTPTFPAFLYPYLN